MAGRRFTPKLAMATAAAMLFASIATIGTAVAEPAEVKVLASVALTSALDELAPQYERATGNKLKIEYSLIADIKKRMIAGETTDVAIVSRPAIDDLQKLDKLAPGSIANVAGTPVAIAARAGAPKPDISSVAAFKQTLLAAKSIVYADPAKGGASGVYFAHVVDQLGIADQIKAKTILVPGAQSGDVVARGEAEIGVAQASEIVPVAGAQLVGPLPGEFASTTLFTAAIGAGSKVPEAAKSLIQFLTGSTAAPVFKAKGFQPG
jgi:molybdate transport system substrate-binding protein